MLTIQPEVRNYSNHSKINFRANESNGVIDSLTQVHDEDYYKSNKDFYSSQIEKLDNSLNDVNTPTFMKKVLKGFRVVSEALLEGWAVAWGAKKGSNIIKSSAVKLEKEVVKDAAGVEKEISKEVLTPFGKSLKKTVLKVAETISGLIEKFRKSKFAQKASDKMTEWAGKMEENSVGKYVVKAFRTVGKFLAKAADKISKPFKGSNASEIYDKAASVTSTTFGVGAGAAGAYNAATRDSRVKQGNVSATEEVETSEDISDDYEDEIEE